MTATVLGARYVQESALFGISFAHSNLPFPLWAAQSVIPIGFAIISLRLVLRLIGIRPDKPVASAIELVNLRVTAVGQVPKIREPQRPADGTVAQATMRTDDVVFRNAQGLAPSRTVFYDRARLPVGETLAGPAIVLQPDSTTVVPPGCTFEVHPSGSMVIRLPA